jgi:hypothetical protein
MIPIVETLSERWLTFALSISLPTLAVQALMRSLFARCQAARVKYCLVLEFANF